MAISITTTSSLNKDYLLDKQNAIYPVFVDGLPYEAWLATGTGNSSQDPTTPTIANSRTTYFQLKATGSSGYQWKLATGSTPLPTGLTLTSDGRISGTPTREGNYTFTVEVTDGVETVQKSLSVTAHPPRNKWHREAKFGVMNTVQPGTYPKAFFPADLPAWEARVLAKWNPSELATYVKDTLGGKYVISNSYAADSVAQWPKTTVTTRPMHTVRNYVKELGDALHAVGLKHMVYFAPDSISNAPRYQNTDPAGVVAWDGSSTYTTNPALVGVKIPGKDGMNSDTPVVWLSGAESAWGTRNTSLFRELAAMDYVDGFWCDVGSGDKNLYDPGAVESDFFRWNNILPILRYIDPWKIIASNPGYNNTRTSPGNKWQYPYIDYVIHEGFADTNTEGNLVQGARVWSEKDLSTDVLNVIDKLFVITGPSVVLSPKTPEMIIDNIKRTWREEGTYTLQWASLADGTLIPEEYKSTLAKIGAFVKANQGFSEKPRIDITGNIVTISTTTNVGSIYYTLDGTDPNEKSNVYQKPFELTNNAVVKAISIQSTSPKSLIARKVYNTLTPPNVERLKKLFYSTTTDVNTTEANNQYKGLRITVLDHDIVLYQIGRKNVGTLSGVHKIYIKKYFNHGDLYFDTFNNNAPLEADGYRYSNVGPIILRAGGSYLIAIQEGTDTYASNTFSTILGNPNVKINGGVTLNSRGDIAPITGSGGQYLNLKYEVIDTLKSVSAGHNIQFQDHTTNAVLPPNAVIFYATNTNDETDLTVGTPSGDYQAVVRVDLENVRTIKGVKIKFRGAAYLTEFYISTSIISNVPEIAQIRTNNYLNELEVSFSPRKARYIYLRARFPDGPNQMGGYMLENFEGIN